MGNADTRQSRLLTPADENQPEYRVPALTRLVYGNAFELSIVALIVLNAVLLAILTFDNVNPAVVSFAAAFDSWVLWIFVAEIVLRIASYGKRPWMFFTSPWNVFDFLVVALIPFFSAQTVILRLLRLLRLVRLLRFLPEVRILTASITRSLPPLASVSVLISFLLFLYAMAGHYLFGEALPQSWGNLAVSMESLFILLTLENFPNYFQEAMSVNPAALVFFLSYVFIIVFTILNVLIGIVINAMDESREEVARSQRDHWREIHDAIDGLEQDRDIAPANLVALRTELLRAQTEANSTSGVVDAEAQRQPRD